MSDPDILRRSLVDSVRLQHSTGESLVAEPRIVTNAGVVASYGARSIAPVEQAYRRRLITHRQHYAAERLYTSYAVGILGIRQAPVGVAPSSPDGALMAAAMAANDYRGCREHVGSRLWPAVFCYVVEEESAGNIAKRMGINPTGMMALLSHGLDVAADYFRLPVE
jgi:hypothetical protein